MFFVDQLFLTRSGGTKPFRIFDTTLKAYSEKDDFKSQ